MDRKTSPLKAKPLRQAGQSVQEQLNELIDDRFMNYGIVLVMAFGLTVFEWIRWYQKTPVNPYLLSIFTIPIILYCIIKMYLMIKQIRNLKLGRDGEKIVAEELDKLRESGCIIFNDILMDGFNIDHVVLSQKGIYLIETKTFSKPKGRKAEVKYNGECILVDGRKPDRDPISQVKNASRDLYKLLAQSTGKKFFVRPVILFPEWYVHENYPDDFMLLNPERFKLKLSQKPKIIDQSDLQLIAFHLSRYIRAL